MLRSRLSACVALLLTTAFVVTGLPVEPVAASPRSVTADERRDPETETLTAPLVAGVDGYFPLSPSRVLDTRVGTGASGSVGAGLSIDVQVTGVGGVPGSGVGAVVFNLTGVGATAGTFVTQWPTGEVRPFTAALNLVPGEVAPNLVIAKVGAGGKVSLFNNAGSVDLVGDVVGWFPVGSSYSPLSPSRVLDTRVGTGASGSVGAGLSIDVQVTGVGGVPGSGVGAVVFNLTGVGATAGTFVTQWPTGEVRPFTAALNLVPGEVAPNLVIAKVGAGGKVSLFNNAGSVDLVGDVVGWFPVGSSYSPLSPSRVLDTRVGTGASGSVGAGLSIDVQVTGVGGVPGSGVGAVVFNLTGVGATAGTFVTQWPTGEVRPFTAALNLVPGEVAPNLVIAKVGAGGKVSLFNNAGSVDLVGDVVGWFPSSEESNSPAPGDGTSTTTVPGPDDTAPTSTTPPTTTTPGTTPTDPDAAVAPLLDGSTALRIVPDSLIMAPGASTTVRLLENDATGTVLHAALLDGSTIMSTDGSTTVELLGDGYLEVHAGSDIETVLFGLQVPGFELALPLTVTVARLRPDVERLGPDEVVFPPADVVNARDVATMSGPLVSATAVGPFALAELAARTSIPVSSDDTPTAPALEGGDWTYPAVLVGDAPPVGTALLGDRGVPLIGVVVEPNGLPSVVRDGYALVTVQYVAVDQIFWDLNYDIGTQELIAVGAMAPAPALGEFETLPDIDWFDSDSGPSRRTHPGPIRHDAPQETPPAGGDEVVHSPGPPVVGGSGVPADAEPTPVQGDERDCKIESGVKTFDLKFGPTLKIVPILKNRIEVHEGGTDVFVNKVGVEFKAEFNAVIKLQGSLGAKISCPMIDLGESYLRPPGWLQLIFTASFAHDLKFILDLKVEGGPKLEFGVTCTVNALATVGTEAIDGASHYTSEWTPPKPTCKPVTKLSLNVTPIPSTFEVTASAPIESAITIRALGRIAEFFGWLFGEPDFGQYKLLTGQIGPRIKNQWESQTTVRDNMAAKAASNLELFATIKPNSAAMDMVSAMFGAPKSSGSGALFEISETALSFYSPVNADPKKPKVLVNGKAGSSGSDTVYVGVGDHVQIETTLDVGAGVLLLPRPSVDSVTVWRAGILFTDSWTEESMFTTQATGGQVPAIVKLDLPSLSAADCERFKSGRAFVITAAMSNALTGWGGQFTLKCVEGKMNFDPQTIDGDADVLLKSEGPETNDWWFDAATVPEWLTVSPMLDTWASPGEQEQRTVTVTTTPPTDCKDRDAQLVVKSKDDKRGTAGLTVKQPNPCYIRFTPSSVTAPGTIITFIKSAGLKQDVWRLDESTVPDWVTLNSATSGALHVGAEETFTFSITVEAREATCEVQLPRNTTIEVTTEFRLTAKLYVLDPKVPKRDDCPKPPSGAGKGDPHMTSFDGVFFEAQVAGEYIYAMSTSATATPVRLVTRQELTIAQGPLVYRPTSIVAAALEVGSHRVEVYSRTPDGVVAQTPIVYLDGVAAPLAESVPVKVSDDLTAVRTGSVLVLTGPGIVVEASAYLGILDVTASTPFGAPYAGLLGSPDGVASNDLMPRSSTTPLTEADIVYHRPALYTLTNSWRIVEPAESPFTLVDDLEPAQPIQNVGDLSDYRERAYAVLEGFSAVCDDTVDVQNSAIDGLAMELALGRTALDLARYSCAYRVTGTASAGGTGVGGLAVTVTVDGLVPCSTTTAPDGTYTCSLIPASTGTVPDAGAPLHVAVVATWPQTSRSLATAAGQFTTRSKVAAAPEVSVLDLAIDPSEVPGVAVSGILLRNGAVQREAVPFTIDSYDGVGRRTATQRITAVPDATTGRIDFVAFLPYGSVGSLVRAEIGVVQADWPSRYVDGLTTGAKPLNFDYDYQPTVVTVRGTMTTGSGTALAPQVVRIDSFAGGSFIARHEVTVTPSTAGGSVGAYEVTQTVPLAADRVVATVLVGVTASDWVTQTRTPLVPGSLVIPLDVVYSPPTLVVSGTFDGPGGGLSGPRVIAVTPYLGAQELDVQVVTVTPVNGAGDYASASITMPIGTTRVVAVARIGVVSEDWVTAETTDLTTGRQTTLDLDVHYDPPVLTVAGVMSGPLNSTEVLAITPKAGSITFPIQNITVTRGSGGAYSTGPVALPIGTLSVVITATIGVSQADWVSTTRTGLHAGEQSTTFDVGYGPPLLTITGHLTGRLGGGEYFTITPYAGTAELPRISVNPGTLGAGGLFTTSPATLPTSATRAVVTANVGTFSGDEFTKDQATLQPGNQTLTFDVDYNPPVVTVSGTMTGVGGAPLGGGPYLVNFVSSKADGSIIHSAFQNVTPDPATGFYSTFMVLPRATAIATFTTRVGNFAGEWPTKSLTPPPAGASTVTLNVVRDVPRLVLSGTVSKNGTKGTGARSILVTPYGTGSTPLSADASVSVALDGSGKYTNALAELPIGTKRAVIHASVDQWAADDVVLEVVDLVPGSRAVTFDVIDVTTTFTAHGHISGLPTSATEANVGFESFDSAGVQTGYGNLWVPLTNGDYTYTAQVPDASATVDWRVYADQYYYRPDARPSVSPFPAVNDFELDIDHTVRRLSLGGTALEDGVGGYASATVRFFTAEGDELTYTDVNVNIDAEGNGDFTIPPIRVPQHAATSTLVAKFGPEFDWYTIPITLGEGDTTVDDISIDYRQTTLDIGGALRRNGVPATRIDATVRSYDVAGVVLTPVTVGMNISTGDGGYFLEIGTIPRRGTRFDLFVTYVVGGESFTLSTGLDVDLGEENYQGFTVATQSLRLTGRLLDGVTPVVPDPRVDLSIEERDGSGHPFGGTGMGLDVEDGGSFDVIANINESAASVAIRIGTGAAVEIDLDASGFTEYHLGDYQYRNGVPIHISGSFPGAGIGDSVTVELLPYSFDPEDWNEAVPYALIGEPIDGLQASVPGSDGQGWSLGANLPIGTTMVEVRAHVNGATEYVNRVVAIDPDATGPIEIGLDVAKASARFVTMHIVTALGDGTGNQACSSLAPSPWVIDFEVRSGPADGPQPVALETYVLPTLDSLVADPDDPDSEPMGFLLRVAIPEADTSLEWGNDTSVYEAVLDFPARNGGGGGFGIPAGQNIEVRLTFPEGCTNTP